MADRERVTFALIERYGESVNCNRWGRILVRAGAAIGPLLNPDGTLFQYSAPAAVERGLWVSCSCGAEAARHPHDDLALVR
jgi:hypothetical protein